VRPTAFHHPDAARQRIRLAVPAFLLMLALHGWFLYQLLRPIKPMPVKVYLSESEVEYEIPFEPIAPQPQPLPIETPAPAAKPIAAVTSVAASQVKPDSSEPTETQAARSEAKAVLAAAQAPPKPSPILDVTPSQAAQSPTLQFNIEELVAAQSTSTEAAEELGAETGAEAPSEQRVMPARPLAVNKPVIDAPDLVSKAPISPLRQLPTAPNAPVVAIEVIKATERIQPEALAKIEFELEPIKPEIAQPNIAPERAVSVQAPKPDAPDLRIDQPRVAISKPAAVQSAPERILTQPTQNEPIARVTVDGAQTRLPKAAVQRPTAPTIDTQASETKPATSASTSNTQTAKTSEAERDWTDWVPTRGDGQGKVDSPSTDPFAVGKNASGSASGQDLLSQAGRAAAAEVGERFENAPDTRRAFRRYNDPFAEDRPNPFAGLRMREPALFRDVTQFLIKKLGAVALAAALGTLNSDELNDTTNVNLGPLIERYLQEHHGDLKRECELKQENSMPDHVRKLICGSY
jgi:hypothetical protein